MTKRGALYRKDQGGGEYENRSNTTAIEESLLRNKTCNDKARMAILKVRVHVLTCSMNEGFQDVKESICGFQTNREGKGRLGALKKMMRDELFSRLFGSPLQATSTKPCLYHFCLTRSICSVCQGELISIRWVAINPSILAH